MSKRHPDWKMYSIAPIRRELKPAAMRLARLFCALRNHPMSSPGSLSWTFNVRLHVEDHAAFDKFFSGELNEKQMRDIAFSTGLDKAVK